MTKIEFLDFYNQVIKKLGIRFEKEYPRFKFKDSPDSVYEEYLNQKTLLRILYGKDQKEEHPLLCLYDSGYYKGEIIKW